MFEFVFEKQPGVYGFDRLSEKDNPDGSSRILVVETLFYEILADKAARKG